MAVAIVPKAILGKDYYEDIDEPNDQIAVQGLVRSSSGAASLYEDNLVTSITIGGGASNTAVTVGAADAVVVQLGSTNSIANLPADATFSSTALGGAASHARITAAALALGNTTGVSWSSTGAANGTLDSGVSRFGAGVVGIGNGTAGDFSASLYAAHLYAYAASTAKVVASSTVGLRLASNIYLHWKDNVNANAGVVDTALFRSAAGVIGASTDGTTLDGTLSAATVLVAAGSTANPSIAYADDPDNGIAFATNAMYFGTGGNNRIIIDGNFVAFNHNVKIGDSQAIGFGQAAGGTTADAWLAGDNTTAGLVQLGTTAGATDGKLDLSTIKLGSATMVSSTVGADGGIEYNSTLSGNYAIFDFESAGSNRVLFTIGNTPTLKLTQSTGVQGQFTPLGFLVTDASALNPVYVFREGTSNLGVGSAYGTADGTISLASVDLGATPATIASAADQVTFNGEPVPHVLATSGTIDLTTPSTTLLYTVPTGKKCVVTEARIRVTSAGGSGSDPAVTVLSDGGDVIPSTTLTSLASTDQSWPLRATGISELTLAADTVDFNVGTGAGASQLDVEVDLIGYLVDA